MWLFFTLLIKNAQYHIHNIDFYLFLVTRTSINSKVKPLRISVCIYIILKDQIIFQGLFILIDCKQISAFKSGIELYLIARTIY